MDFWIGSVNQYTKTLARQTQWKLKKQSGDFTGHAKSLGEQMSSGRTSSIFPDTDERDDRLSAILTKAQMGKKLSGDELEYVREKDPVLYEKLLAAEREQKAYEEALKRCKTRDEAQRLHVSKLGEIMEAAKNGDEGAIVRLNRLTQTMVAFTGSEEYHELPTEAEQAIEREAGRSAEREALLEEAERKRAERAGDREKAEPAPETAAAAEPEAETETEAEAVPETGDTARAPTRAKAETRAAPIFPDTDQNKTPADAAVSAVPYGRQAYLDQQNETSRARPRRRAVDTEA